MKNKVMKKILIGVIIAAVAVGGVYGGWRYKSTNGTAEVYNVGDMDYGYWGDEVYGSGRIINDYNQSVYLETDDLIKEVYVTEGQEVAAGDVLLELDMTQVELNLKMAQLEVQSIQNEISVAQNELKRLKNTTPIQEVEPVDPEPVDPKTLWGEEKDGAAYRYITTDAVPYNQKTADGTMENPYRYLCTEDAWILGEALCQFADDQTYVVLEVHEGNTVKGDLVYAWDIDGLMTLMPDADSRWTVMGHMAMSDEDLETEEQEDVVVTEGYTSAELSEMITQKQSELSDLDLELRKAKLEVTKCEANAEEGVITATVDGTVRNVQSIDEISYDEPFLEVSGSEGLYVSGSISELLLDQVGPGQVVDVMSWETGISCEAVITEITDYPATDTYSYSEGNSNVTYYGYIAYVEDTTGLKNGEYVDLTMNIGVSEDGETNVFLPKAYLRSENGQYYVLKADENNRLVKQYVQTGRSLYGSALEIKSGLTRDDRIAFPYGKTAKEGMRCVDGDTVYY